MRALLAVLFASCAAAASAQTFEIRLVSGEPTTQRTPSPEPRRSAPISMTFNESSLEVVLESLGKLAGVKVLFDSDFRDKRVSFVVKDETFDAALRQITLTNRLFTKALDARTIVIVPDSPAKHQQYDAWTASKLLPSVRNRAPINLAFTEASLQKVFEALGEAAGMKVLFDNDFRDRKVSIRFDGETFEAALDQLTLVYRLFYRAIDANSIVIAPDSPAVRRRYDEAVSRPSAGPLGCGGEPASASPAGSAVGFADGLWVGFTTRLSTPPADAPVDALFQPDTQGRGHWSIDRIVSDRERRRYVGYRLELRAARDGPPFQVAVRPLPEASWGRLCRSCPPEAQRTKIARYPEAFELGSGGSFALEVMENAATGEKIVDQVTILQAFGRAGKEAPPSGRFKVQFNLAREADGLSAGVCVRDLDSGETLGGIPHFKIDARSNNLAFSHDGRTRDGRSLSISVRMTLENEGRTALYAVEIWEAHRMVHSEEARFPVLSS